MSKPKIVRFDFGSSTETSELQNKNKKEKEPDNLILVDAFWIKDGMKIRFVPHQMDVVLFVVFKLQHDDGAHERDKAEFHLKFEVEGTWYENENKEIVIKYKNIKDNNYQKLVQKYGVEKINAKDSHTRYFYYEIREFTSDLTAVKF